jgi:MFS family permease
MSNASRGDLPPPGAERAASTLAAPRLPPSIYVVAIVSMLNDIATDMVTPLIPIFLATTLVSGPVVLGAVEGVANAVAAALRLWAGRYSDVSGGRRKPLAVTGYVVSNLMRPLLALATVWWHVVLIRALDRVGKGIRSAPRDALIVDLAPPSLRARAFGIHSAFDNLGAVGGALIGALVVSYFAFNLRDIVLLSALPGALAVLLFALAVREPVKHAGARVLQMRFHWHDVPVRMRGYLLTVTLFTFARTAELFVILRAHELGAGLPGALLLWAAFNFIKIFANYGAGILADRFGRITLLVPGWLLYGVAMLVLCFVSNLLMLWIATLFFGFALSISEGVERAVIGDHAKAEERGTLFGWYYALVGLASIPAGLIIGGLWQVFGAPAAYGFAAGVAFLAGAILHFRIGAQISRPA